MVTRPAAEVAAAHPSTALRFLVVDDDPINRKVLLAMLRSDGHEVIEAADGAQAVAAFEHESPDMVLMDVMMPVMDGHEATRRIKQFAGQRFVPVIFLTALHGEAALARCLDAGGEDFLSKPYQHAILRAKIGALLRTRALHEALERSNADLREHHRRLQAEQVVAERLFRNIVHRGCLDAPNIRHLISPAALFNGDLLLAARGPSGALRVMLGDFAGHSLPAAVGTIPVSELFYTMTARGCSIGEVVKEIHRKLRSIMPTGQFLAACLVELDRAGRTLSVWNGGIPDLLVRRADGTVTRFPSRHLPLGIIAGDTGEGGVELADAAAGDRVILYSDGLIESRNARETLFGQARLDSIVSGHSDPFQALCEALAEHRAQRAADDDVTLVEIEVIGSAPDPALPDMAGLSASGTWQVNLVFEAGTLRRLDPLPVCLQLLMELQGLYAHRERLYLILSELFSNALEHGLLQLDSSRKATAQGFTEYYHQREQKLAALVDGTIRLSLMNQPREGGGRLHLVVEDSGPGFDAGAIPIVAGEQFTPSGHGLPLVRALCRELIVHGRGNRVEAIYDWSR